MYIGGLIKMKKITTIFIFGLLLASSISVAGLSYRPQEMEIIQYSKNLPRIESMKISSYKTEFLSLELEGVSTYISKPGEPNLPKIVHAFELPFGVKDIDVSVQLSSFHEKRISGKIRPGSELIPLTSYEYTSINKESSIKQSIYQTTEYYPNFYYSFDTTCGINEENKPTTFVTIDLYPVQYSPLLEKISYAEEADISITYTNPTNNIFPITATNDLVVIAPEVFSDALSPLIDHKNNYGVNTFLKTTEEIFDEYNGFDKPEQIKYFIKDAKENLGITYVLIVGGLNSIIDAKPRDDINQGWTDWYVPVRYTNLFDDPAFPLASDLHDPGIISDLYYADLYREGGEFESWDPNGDGIYAAWDKPGVPDDEDLDFVPDVYLGRLACRSIDEVNTVVQKIINYESSPQDQSWFKKMIVVSGDGFLDQTDLNILWDTNELETGTYTIYAQSFVPSGESGPIEEITVTVDHAQQTQLTFNHDDHLRVTGFPGEPIAEICTVSEGDVLGSSDFYYTPTESEAYCNEFYYWANMSYSDGVLTIRGKSYDPKPYGNISSIHVWIKDESDTMVLSEWRNDTEMYYEGEWTTGEKALLGRGGALYYMPDDFQKEILWGSNGKFTGPEDIIESVSEGCGFLFFSGHGSPNVWTDQYPGIPGNRGYGGIPGIQVTTLKPWPPFFDLPLFPLDTLSNAEKLPVAIVGGCHNSQFNVSMVRGLLDIMHYFFPSFPPLSMWCHGYPVPETFSWRLVRNPNGGAIASIGNTGLGYGMPGKELTTGGGDSWITIEFFKQYGSEGHDILGQAYGETLKNYVQTFDMTDLPAGHPKTIEQWVLLGDPTLKLGGYN
jgi:peptidase C25-like protein